MMSYGELVAKVQRWAEAGGRANITPRKRKKRRNLQMKQVKRLLDKTYSRMILGEWLGSQVVAVTTEPAPENQTGPFLIGDATVFHFAPSAADGTVYEISSEPRPHKRPY